jgi:hypothetical protein
MKSVQTQALPSRWRAGQAKFDLSAHVPRKSVHFRIGWGIE